MPAELARVDLIVRRSPRFTCPRSLLPDSSRFPDRRNHASYEERVRRCVLAAPSQRPDQRGDIFLRHPCALSAVHCRGSTLECETAKAVDPVVIAAAPVLAAVAPVAIAVGSPPYNPIPHNPWDLHNPWNPHNPWDPQYARRAAFEKCLEDARGHWMKRKACEFKHIF